MLEDLFSVVKVRFNGDKADDDKKKTDIPKGLLFKCPRCRNVTFMEEFQANGKVCPHCNYHSRLTAKERLDITIDKGSFEEFDMDMPETKDYFFKQDGKEVYKFATKALPNAVEQACAKIEISPDDLDWIVPHQANIRIIETAAKHLGVSMDKFPVYIDRYGNTSSASIPIAFCDAVAEGRIKRGDKVCLVGFGGGLTYGAAVFEY